jgi:hypothetical protein
MKGQNELILIGIFIGYIIYLNKIRSVIKDISEENRIIKPNSVYRCFIPYYNLYWQPKMINDFTNSVKKEFEKKIWEKVFGTFKKMFIHILGVKKIVGKKLEKFFLKILGVKKKLYLSLTL